VAESKTTGIIYQINLLKYLHVIRICLFLFVYLFQVEHIICSSLRGCVRLIGVSF